MDFIKYHVRLSNRPLGEIREHRDGCRPNVSHETTWLLMTNDNARWDYVLHHWFQDQRCTAIPIWILERLRNSQIPTGEEDFATGLKALEIVYVETSVVLRFRISVLVLQFTFLQKYSPTFTRHVCFCWKWAKTLYCASLFYNDNKWSLNWTSLWYFERVKVVFAPLFYCESSFKKHKLISLLSFPSD